MSNVNESTSQLFDAIKSLNVDKVEEAIKNGADVNAKDYRNQTPMEYLMTFGSTEIAEVLINHQAELKGALLEHAAYGRGGSKMTKLLLDAGADVNEKTYGGYTPLLIAAGRGYTDVVKVLLEAGADVFAVGESNTTAKNLAYSRGYSETAKLIAQYEK
jgi:ankyrin repeat protein